MEAMPDNTREGVHPELMDLVQIAPGIYYSPSSGRTLVRGPMPQGIIVDDQPWQPPAGELTLEISEEALQTAVDRLPPRAEHPESGTGQ
jgi:hypothetical protein